MAARIVVTEFVSLDGVMEAPGGETFKYPGWTFEFDRGDDGNEFKLEETRQSDALVIGSEPQDSLRPRLEAGGRSSARRAATPTESAVRLAGRADRERP